VVGPARDTATAPRPRPPWISAAGLALLGALAIVVIVALLYWPTGPEEPLLDDSSVAFTHPSVRAIPGAPPVLAAPFYHDRFRPIWRPLATGSYRLDFAREGAGRDAGTPAAAGSVLGEVRRAMVHSNLALRALTLLLLYGLIVRLGLGAGAAVLVAALLALHPANAESLWRAVGRSELLAQAGLLAAVVLYVGVLRPPSRGVRLGPVGRALAWTATGSCFAAALAAHEVALVLPLLLLGYEWMLGPRTRRAPETARGANAWVGIALAGALILVWASARAWAMEVWPPELLKEPARDFLGALQGGERLRWALALPWHYLRLVFVAAPIVPGYGYLLARPEEAPPVTLGMPSTFGVTQASDAAMIGGAGVLVAALALSLLLRRRAPVAAWGFWIFLFSLVVVLPFWHAHGDLASTRHLFLPLAGLLLAIVALLVPAMRAGRSRRRVWLARALGVALGLVAALALEPQTRALGQAWRAEPALLAHFEREAPLAPEVPLARAGGAVLERRFDAAAGYLEEAIGRFPRLPRALLTLGSIRAQQQQTSIAKRIFTDATVVAERVAPGSSLLARAHIAVGTLYARSRMNLTALDHFRQAVAADSNNIEALSRAGLLECIALPTAPDGIRHIDRALRLDRGRGRLGPAAEQLKRMRDRAAMHVELAQGDRETYAAAMEGVDSLLATPPPADQGGE